MDFAIARISTKGQLVIPSELRGDIKPGDEFLIVRDEDRFVIKNVKSIAADILDDLAFAEHVERAWKEYDEGKAVKMTRDEFLKELRDM